jgi:hypothetical protein
MNSLTELNGYVNGLSFEYEDLRSARVIFDRLSATNQTKIVNEGEAFPLSIGIEITDVVNYATSEPTLTVDIVSVYNQGVRVDWGTLPAGVTLDEPSNGLYVISGIDSKAIWDQIKQPNIVLPTNVPNSFVGTFTYTVTIDYYDANLGNQDQEYTVAVSVLDVTFLTTPLEFVYAPNEIKKILNTPQIASYLDADYPSATWTITATVSQATSIDTFSSSATGGTFTFNSGTKGFTIVGTRTQVNNHLANISIDSNANEIDFVIYYVLSNSVDAVTDSRTQVLTNRNIQFFSNPTDYNQFYTEDSVLPQDINGHPLITDNAYSGSGNYTLEIYPSATIDIVTLASQGVGGTSSFNNTTKVLTIVGTRAQVNSHLPNITVITAVDVDYLFQIFYKLTTPTGGTSTKIQQLICSSNDTEVSNMTLTRSYIGNRSNSIFSSNTPQIIDFDIRPENIYTVTFDCSFGLFSIDDVSFSSPLSYTGTRTQVNSIFSLVKFFPNKDISANGFINFTQIKNSVTQVSTSFAVTGTAGVFQNPRKIIFTSTQNFTPTLEDVAYSKWAAFIAGAGGAGGSASDRGGGGGGAGETIYVYDKTFAVQTYTVTIGTSGARNTNVPSDGGDGTNSSIDGFVGRGGKGGKASGTGGASGQGHAGGTPGSQSAGGGGGNGTGANNNTPAVGTNGANTFGSTTVHGNGGNDLMWFINKSGQLEGPQTIFSGGGGGGGANDVFLAQTGDSNTISGRGGGNNPHVALAGNSFSESPANNNTNTTDKFNAGVGGGGGGGQNPVGANGSGGIIEIEIY